jgi:hypothetical protein
LRRQLIFVALVVLALRLPFLNQAFQGDDVLYLTEAAHAQIDPLHPKHTTYVFMGRDIDMRGQSHPPLNAWFLALLLAAGKTVSEIPFHAAYILFSRSRSRAASARIRCLRLCSFVPHRPLSSMERRSKRMCRSSPFGFFQPRFTSSQSIEIRPTY